MSKRAKLEITRDILKIIQENPRGIKITPLITNRNIKIPRVYSFSSQSGSGGL